MNLKPNVTLALLSVAALSVVAIPLLTTKAIAEEAVQQGPPPAGFTIQPGQRGQGGPQGQAFPGQGFQPMMGGGGQAVMVADGNHLFILQGGMMYKVNKSDLRVERSAELPRPQMQFRREGAPGSAPPPGGGTGGGE